VATYTQLSTTAVPGQRYSFSAKASPGVPHTGDFTALSVLGVPGAIHAFSAKTAATEDEDRSPWNNWWRDHTGWYDQDAPSLADLVMSGQQTFIEAPTGEDVPAFIPTDKESEDLLLDAWGEDGLVDLSQSVGINSKEAENLVRWMAREERKAIVEWRSRLINDQILIILLAMLDD